MSSITGENSSTAVYPQIVICCCKSSKDHCNVKRIPMIRPTPSTASSTVVQPPPPPPPAPSVPIQPAGGSGVVEAVGKKKRKKYRVPGRMSLEQKLKVRTYAESVKWRLLKEDQGRMIQFCDMIGITTHMCTNWINNYRRKQPSTELTL